MREVPAIIDSVAQPVAAFPLPQDAQCSRQLHAKTSHHVHQYSCRQDMPCIRALVRSNKISLHESDSTMAAAANAMLQIKCRAVPRRHHEDPISSSAVMSVPRIALRRWMM